MIDVVVTTISDGAFLKRWGELIIEAERDDVRLVVIPDMNTPDLTDMVDAIRRVYGVTIECPSPDEQTAFLRSLGDDGSFVPWRSDNRRNVGFLLSWRDGADVMISVDDDNFPVENGGLWFAEHEIVAGYGYAVQPVVSSPSGWFSSMIMLGTRPAGGFCQRGYPFFARYNADLTESREQVDVSINQGLWLGDPDVDALTRLVANPVSHAMNGLSYTLAPATWAPVNSQNTAIRREVIPVYWFARMPDWGGRMGDIFSGYFAEACAKHLGHAVRFGTPLVTQERNHHDLLRDLELETPFYRLLEEFLGWLPGVKLEGSTYRDAYESLSDALDDYAGTLPPARERVFLKTTSQRMVQWLGLCDQIGRQ